LPLDEQQPRRKDEEADLPCQLVVRSLDELRPHPSYVRHQLSVTASQLSALLELGDVAFQQPIVISIGGVIVDGYARLELARRQGRRSILCLEYDLTEEEALRWLIQTHRPLRGLNPYNRTLLALDLAPSLQEAARTNQRIGGQNKGSSNLTEAQKVDVRSKTASTAGVSSGQVAKVEQVSKCAPPRVQDALKSSEIRVHKAWQWRRLTPQGQEEKLEDYRSQKGTEQTSRRLIQKHVQRLVPTQLIPPTLGELLKPMLPDRAVVLDLIVVSEIGAPGKIAYLTGDAMLTLRRTEKST
jgi:ParB-like chromosome segregation protein Spo0J